MGTVKKSLVKHINKRNFYFIKVYSFYRKDILGFFRMKRLYKYRKIIYNILKRKRRFYYLILNVVYKGFKFFVKRYKYKANLLFVKKRLKIFYGFFRDSYIGKLGQLVKRKMGGVVNYFFSIIERRIDVLLVRALYSTSVRFSRYFIYKKVVFVNNKLVLHPKFTVFIGDIVKLSALPKGSLFFRYVQEKSLENFKARNIILFKIRNSFIRWFLFIKFKLTFLHAFDFIGHKAYYIPHRHERGGPLGPYNLKYLKRNYKEAFLRLIYNFVLRFFRFNYYMLKKYKNKLKRGMYNSLKKKYIKYKEFYSVQLVFGTVLIVKLLIIINRFFKRTKINSKKKRWVYRLYGLVNLRFRLRKFYYFLKPRWFPKRKTRIYSLRRYSLISPKYFRVWKFSKNVYKYFKRFSRLFFVFKGYPSFLEVNYKIHCFLLIKNPTVKSVTYPFSVDKSMFFKYFKLKSYF